MVVRSAPGETPWNAIDSNLFIDDDGAAWLSWGSYWNGLYLQRADAASGKPATGTAPINIARRPEQHAVEAPYLIKRDEYYYLFVSYDRCCNGADSTYKTMVGRSPANR